MNFLAHVSSFIELSTKVIAGVKVAYEAFEKVRQEYLEWRDYVKRSGRLLQTLPPKEAAALQILNDFLDKHPDYRTAVNNADTKTKRLLTMFEKKTDNSNPFKEEEKNPFDDGKSAVVPSGTNPFVEANKASLTERSTRYTQEYRNGRVYAVNSNKAASYGAPGLFYSDNGQKSSLSQSRGVENFPDISLAELRDSYWLRGSLHASDAMYMAMMFPGHQAVPYFDGENLPRLGAGTVTLTDTFGSTTHNWTIMVWSPVVGAIYGGDGYWDAQGSDATFAGASTNAVSAWSTQAKPGLASTSGLVSSGYTTLYTAAPPFTNNVFPWAGEMSFTIETPVALSGGTVYRALIPASQYFSGLTYRQILTISQRESLVAGKEYSIRVGVQNRKLVHEVTYIPSTMSTNNMSFQTELVAVVMIHNPSVSLTGGTPGTFDVIQKVAVNYSFAPLHNNPWTASLSVDDVSLDYNEVLPRRLKEYARSGHPLTSNSKVRDLKSEAGTPLAVSPSNEVMTRLKDAPPSPGYTWNVNEAQSFLQSLIGFPRNYYDLPTQLRDCFAQLAQSVDFCQLSVREWVSQPDNGLKPSTSLKNDESFLKLLRK